MFLVFIARDGTFFERGEQMKKVLWPILAAVALGGNGLWGQVTIQENYFNDFITFYVSSVDVTTGAQDVELFELEILVDEPVLVEIEFKIRINSIPLGLDYEDEFLTVTTEQFTLEGPVRVRNTELDMNTTHLTYSGPPGGTVPISIPSSNITYIDMAELESMQSLIMQSGRLPDGTYRFSLEVKDATGNVLDGWDKVVVSAHPISLELISPGGPLEDTTNTAITTTYPFFQWESDPCAICYYQIRVAEFKPGEHSTMEDAIEDQTVLPLDQAAGYHPPPDEEPLRATSLQYPMTGAIDLEAGHIYVWQVQKAIPTTEGDEFILSPIWAFQIVDPTRVGAPGAEAGGVAQGPILQFLQNAMGGNKFDETFGPGGDLEGFSPNQVVRLNGEPMDPARLTDLSNALQQGAITILNLEVQ